MKYITTRIYCDGAKCSRKESCALHALEKNNFYICFDRSINGSCGELKDFRHFKAKEENKND